MSADQPVMVRLRRNTTSTPWGFRMQGGNEYGAVLYIQKVNPKSVASRQGLREGDRLLYVNGAPAHQMNHEQAKMEIIRGGNELDILVQRQAVQIPHRDQVDSHSQLVEESTEYRGYTNPNVQSRSFKIIQQSLSIEEAEEGTFTPSGAIPGEMIVVRAYNEGKRRREELSETHPRNFTSPGMSPYRDRAQYYGVDDYDESRRFKESGEGKEPCEIVAAKKYEGVKSAPHQRPPVENGTAQPQYKLMSDNVSVTDSILSPNVQGRKPMVVKNIPNEHQQPTQHNAAIMQTPKVVQGSHTQTSAYIQHQTPVHQNAHGAPMVHTQRISHGSPAQVPIDIPPKQVVQHNAPPPHIQAITSHQQPQQKNYNANMTHIQSVSQNHPSQTPTVVQNNTVVIQAQRTSQGPSVQAPAANQQPRPPVQQTTTIMQVQKAPSVVAPVAFVSKGQSNEPANVRRRVRPTRKEATLEKSANTQADKITVETKTVSAAPQIIHEVQREDLKAEVKKQQNANEVVNTSVSIAATEIETINEHVHGKEEVTINQDAPAKEALEKSANTQADKITVETKTVSAAPQIVHEVQREDLKAEVKKQQNANEVVNTSVSIAATEIETINEDVHGKEEVTINQDAPAKEAVENKTTDVLHEERQGSFKTQVLQATSTDSSEKSESAEPQTSAIQVSVEPSDNANVQAPATTESHTDLTVEEPATEMKESNIENQALNEQHEEPVHAMAKENSETASVEADVSLKMDSVPLSENQSAEKVDIPSKEVDISNQSQIVVNEELSVTNAVEHESINVSAQSSANVVIDASLEADSSVLKDTSQNEVILQSGAEVKISTEEEQSFTLKLDDDANEPAAISADSVEFSIDATNIEFTSEAETSEAAANVSLVLSEENISNEAVTDVNFSINEESVADVTIGLADEAPEPNTVETDATAADFSFSLNEEIKSNDGEKISETITEKSEETKDSKNDKKSSENVVRDKDVKASVNASTEDKNENKNENISKKEGTKESTPTTEEAQAKQSINDSKTSKDSSSSYDKKAPSWRTGRTRFTDSQGGVQARLQRLQKK